MKRPYKKRIIKETPDNPCVICNSPMVLCKGLCQACYSKKQRGTKEGIERTRNYNITKGREAQKKYREKFRLGKPPREPKRECECGQMSSIKGYCKKCYYRYYQRKRQGYKGTYQRGKTHYNYMEVFKIVLKDVKMGVAIYKSLKKQKIHSSSFYRNISAIQKSELIACKTVGFSIDEDD